MHHDDEAAGPKSPEQATDVPIGEALRLLREREKVTQAELARRGGPDHRTISHWETGRKCPSLRLLLQYLTALELDLHDLQAALDQVSERPDKLTSRFTLIERRLSILEHSLRQRATEVEETRRRIRRETPATRRVET